MPSPPKYDSDPPGPERGSDRPPDFRRKRDRVMKKLAPGARVTEEMVSERDRMEARLRLLEVENAKLRARVELDTAVVELLGRVERLEKEKQELLHRIEGTRSEPHFEEHFRRVEADFENLASLYVASSQLHSSLSPRRVARCIKEILAQLLGAKTYSIYLESDDRSALVPVPAEGAATGERLAIDAIAATPIGDAFSSGRLVLNEEADPSEGSVERPCAVIPLSFDDRIVGVIVIIATLPQKTSFRPVDFELFKLLGRHAALALAGASLFAAAERRVPRMEALLDLST